MIQIENVGDGRLRFMTKYPSTIEIITIDGKTFVHSEKIQVKSPTAVNTPVAEVKSNMELKEAK